MENAVSKKDVMRLASKLHLDVIYLLKGDNNED